MDKPKRFSVIKVTEEKPVHYAVWNEKFLGAVAGRFIKKKMAEQLCDRLNAGETPDYNQRKIIGI